MREQIVEKSEPLEVVDFGDATVETKCAPIIYPSYDFAYGPGARHCS